MPKRTRDPKAPHDPSTEPFPHDPADDRARGTARAPRTRLASPASGLTGPRLRRLLAACRPHRRLLLADLGCAVVVSVTALLLPICPNLVTRRLGGMGLDGMTMTALGPVLGLGAAMLALLGLQALGTFFVSFHGHMMGTRMEASLRQELFEHCQRLSLAFHDRTRMGQLMSRIANDPFHLGELYHHGPEDLVIAVLKTAGVVAILLWLDGPLTFLILLVLPAAIAHALRFGRRMNRALALTAERIGAVNERVEDALAGVRVVQSFGGETREARRFAAENARFVDSRHAGYWAESHVHIGTLAFPQLITVLVITAGAVRVTQGAMGVPDLLTFLLCVAVLYDPVSRTANLVRLWQEGVPGFLRMLEVLEVEPEVRDRPGARPLARPRGSIAFERVGFRYDEGGPHVLRDLSFAVRPGEFVALVGPSGVGKSTLCALIPRFYDVTEGRILVDGADIRDVTQASLRRALGVVQQDVHLFAGSAAENIRYGRAGATDAEVWAAARSAAAHDFIMALPQGYDTDVGQRGVRLSGGQRQRLTIARAVLKDPPVPILDGATSALDTASERAVQAALMDLARGRTTLAIAHRLSTVGHADRILVLTGAGVAEEGSHDALVARGGVHARLHASQARM